MRMLLKVQMDVDAANRAISDGSMSEMMERVMGDIQPEAAYFTAIDGMRTALIFFDLQDPSQIPSVAEPFFQTLEASLEFLPVMNRDELRAGLERLA